MSDTPELRCALSPKTVKHLVTGVLVAINVGWIAAAFLNQPLAKELVTEDGIVQWFQFFFLLLTASYCLGIVRGRGIFYEEGTIRNVFLMLFLATLVLAFEEISWGQRIFNIKTPDVIGRVNVQNEITLHNLFFFQRYRHWLLLLFGCTGLALIHMGAHPDRIDARFLFVAPPAFFSVAFGLIIVSGIALEIGFLLRWLHPGNMADGVRFWAGRFSEIGELGVSISAFSYAANRFSAMCLMKVVTPRP